jgi:hypothetical protein
LPTKRRRAERANEGASGASDEHEDRYRGSAYGSRCVQLWKRKHIQDDGCGRRDRRERLSRARTADGASAEESLVRGGIGLDQLRDEGEEVGLRGVKQRHKSSLRISGSRHTAGLRTHLMRSSASCPVGNCAKMSD